MSRILFVVARPLEINTSASIRNKAMLEGLLQNGHMVDLVTTVPNTKHPAYDNSLSVNDIKTTYVEFGAAVQKLTRLCGKNKLFLCLKSMAYQWKTRHEVYDHFKAMADHTECVDLAAGQYDYIISSSDPKPSHLFVLRLLEKQGADFQGKWIQIWGDPFLADITRKNRNQKRIRAEEERLLAAAGSVFYVSRLTLEQQKRMYPEYAEKMCYTPILYAKEHVTENRKLSSAETIELAYCGDYNSSVRNLVPLCETVQQSSRLHLTICGGSDHPMQSTDKICSMGRVAYATVCDVEDHADILVFVANRCGTQIPGKIYQYAGTNKPILFILDGDAEMLKKQFDGYDRFVFAENTQDGILRALDRLIQNDKAYVPLETFSKERVMKNFLR